MGSQATPGTQVQSTSNQSKSEPHPYLQDDLLRQLAGLRNWEDLNPNAPLNQIANASPAQQSARDSTWYWGNKEINNTDAAFAPTLDYLTATARGDNLDVAKNPQFLANLDAVNRRQNEVWADTVAPAINSAFGSARRTASGLHGAEVVRSATDLGRAQADAGISAMSNLFNAGLDRQMGAARAIPGVLSQRSGLLGNWLGALQGIGASDTANTQARLDNDMRNFYAQPDFLTNMSQRYLGMFPGGQTLGSGTTQAWTVGGNSGGGAGQYIGPAMSLAGSALAFF